jgi:excisionase family DNA binding protein
LDFIGLHCLRFKFIGGTVEAMKTPGKAVKTTSKGVKTPIKAKRAPVQERITLKIPEAAQIVGCGIRAIRNGIGAGDIPHIRLGKNIVIPRAAFLKWIESSGTSEVR